MTQCFLSFPALAESEIRYGSLTVKTSDFQFNSLSDRVLSRHNRLTLFDRQETQSLLGLPRAAGWTSRTKVRRSGKVAECRSVHLAREPVRLAGSSRMLSST